MKIGVDLGGTKIEVMALSNKDQILYNRRIATPRGDYAATVEAIVLLVLEAEQHIGEKGTVGIGMPGTFSRATGLVKNANSTWLNGKPLDKDISARLQRPVRMANDANCFALSEALKGAAAGANSVFGVILGTGVGGGIVINQEILTGPNGISGEWGHNPLPWRKEDEIDLPCYCGKQGCIETHLSGPGFANHYQHISGGETMRSEEIMAAYRQGEVLATKAFNMYVDKLARACAVVVNILDPEVIVLGGGLSNIDEIYPKLQQQLPQHVFSDAIDIKIVPAMFGDASGIRGAAYLWS